MIVVTFTSLTSAQDQLDAWNILAGVEPPYTLAPIYFNETENTWAIVGTDCIENGGLGRAQIEAEVNQLPSFNIDTYYDLFTLGYTQID